ncbi:sensor histidine kinase [Microseira wollei]|nr:HAMP domain-containing sensor histidine kinase [Microseira wollei]
MTEDLDKILQSMQVGTTRIQEIIRSVRTFSRLDKSEYAVDIHEGIDSTLLSWRDRLQETPTRSAIQVVKDYSNLPLIECYAEQLNQVFMHLLTNAIDAIEQSNQGRSLAAIEPHPHRIWIHTEAIDLERIKIIIADNGIGIPENLRSRIFAPFFTTKPVGKGTGLGLSISYQIVTTKHNGKLYCDSTPGERTKFTIEIPIR